MKKLFTILLLSIATTSMSQKIDITVNLKSLSDSVYYNHNDSFVNTKYNVVYHTKDDTCSFITCNVSYLGTPLGTIYGGFSMTYLKTLYPVLLDTIYDRKGLKR